MGAFVLPIVLVILVLVLAAGLWGGIFSSTSLRFNREERRRVVEDPHQLQYDVPGGQDPASIATALTLNGFEAVPAEGGVHRLLIRMPLGAQQREEVRIVIENEAMGTMNDDTVRPSSGPVHFRDES